MAQYQSQINHINIFIEWKWNWCRAQCTAHRNDHSTEMRYNNRDCGNKSVCHGMRTHLDVHRAETVNQWGSTSTHKIGRFNADKIINSKSLFIKLLAIKTITYEEFIFDDGIAKHFERFDVHRTVFVWSILFLASPTANVAESMPQFVPFFNGHRQCRRIADRKTG